MNKHVFYYQRNERLMRVMTNNPEASLGKPEIVAANEAFAANNNQCGILLAGLAYPRSVIYRPKQDQQKKLRQMTAIMAGMGMLLATRQKDAPKTDMYKEYKLKASKGPSWELSQHSLQVAGELAKEDEEVAASVGLTATDLVTFKGMADQFVITLVTTDTLLKQRKAASEELNILMKENADIMRLQFDPYVNFVKDVLPAFNREYKIARSNPLPRKYAKKPEEIITELSGTATDSATGNPLVDATVLITELNLIAITDEDGYYLFDEIPVCSFNISCHAKGYKLPADEKVTITGTEPLQINFSLDPDVVEKVV